MLELLVKTQKLKGRSKREKLFSRYIEMYKNKLQQLKVTRNDNREKLNVLQLNLDS